jgi:hypothetical protein
MESFFVVVVGYKLSLHAVWCSEKPVLFTTLAFLDGLGFAQEVSLSPHPASSMVGEELSLAQPVYDLRSWDDLSSKDNCVPLLVPV